VNTRLGLTLHKVLTICVVAALGFALFQETMRAAEARAALALLSAVGLESVRAVDATSVLVISGDQPAFHVLITASCSSLASLIAFACLGPLAPRGSAGRRTLAVLSACCVIAVGNAVRIAGSIAVGLVAGRASLVLFHDWVGSMFTFVYTMSGYVLMLALLLPKGERASRTSSTRPVVLDAA
jgi:carbamoyl-phosphate synthase large subunit